MADETLLDKNEGPWACKLCQMVFKDIYSYTDHLESKEHVKGIIKRKYAQKYLDAKAMLEEKSTKNSSKSTDVQKMSSASDSIDKEALREELDDDDSDSDEDEVYTCEVCEKICTGLINYKLHLQGYKHLKKVKQSKILRELKEKKIVPQAHKTPDSNLLSQLTTSSNMFASSDLTCEVCNVQCTGPGAFKQHIKGEAHKKKQAKNRLLQDVEAEGLPLTVPSEENIGVYSCDTCQKAFSGIVPYKQHLDSASHRKQERDTQRLQKLKNLCIASPTSTKLVCKECRKTFSGSAPFEEHLRSSLHGKLKKKMVLYEELRRSHPEMVDTSIKVTSDSEDSENEAVKPACAVCNMIFSGPEAAMDHFSSLKHKKALKKKKRIEKYKAEKKSSKRHPASDPEDKKEDAEEVGSSDDSFEKLSSIPDD